METQINEVQSYFKNKLLTGDFKVIDQRFYNIIEVLIDDKYKFVLWRSETPRYTMLWQKGCFMSLSLEENEAIALFNILTHQKKTEILAVKRAEIEKLQQELMEGV